MDTPVTLEIPADARFVHVARAVATGVAANLALPFDSVEDLRLAVGESCNRLLAAAPTDARILLALSADEGELTVTVSLRGAVGQWPPHDPAADLSWTLLAGLADAAREELAGGQPSIVTTWRTLAPSAG